MAKIHSSRIKEELERSGLKIMSKLILFPINAIIETEAVGGPNKYSTRQKLKLKYSSI